jgi:hypothetical protein
LHLQQRLGTSDHAQAGAGAGQAALLPESRPLFPFDTSLRMRDPTHQMLLLFPNRAPNRHIVKATVEQPRDRHLVLERRNGLAYGRERALHFVWFADETGCLAADQAMVQDPTVLGVTPSTVKVR